MRGVAVLLAVTCAPTPLAQTTPSARASSNGRWRIVGMYMLPPFCVPDADALRAVIMLGRGRKPIGARLTHASILTSSSLASTEKQRSCLTASFTAERHVAFSSRRTRQKRMLGSLPRYGRRARELVTDESPAHIRANVSLKTLPSQCACSRSTSTVASFARMAPA